MVDVWWPHKQNEITSITLQKKVLSSVQEFKSVTTLWQILFIQLIY